jgi:hypothetical protein
MALDDATRMTEAISKNKKAFVDIMMIEELGLGAGDDSPFKNALVTFFSFLLFGLMPCIIKIIYLFNFSTTIYCWSCSTYRLRTFRCIHYNDCSFYVPSWSWKINI